MAQIFLPVGGPLVDKAQRATDAMWGWMRQITAAVGGSGGGAVAPADAQYVTYGADATLTNERVATSSATITVNLGTVGQIKWDGAEQNLQKGATVTITNAQFKALETTTIEVIPAQGATVVIPAFWIALVADFSAGAYTNVDNDGYLSAYYAATGEVGSYIANDSSIPLTYFDDFCSAADSQTVLQTFQYSEPVNLWGNLPQLVGLLPNVAIHLKINNGGAGALTGGNAANTLKATPFWIEVSL